LKQQQLQTQYPIKAPRLQEQGFSEAEEWRL